MQKQPDDVASDETRLASGAVNLPNMPGMPDLALFALTEDIVASWHDDQSAGRAKLLAAMQAYPTQAVALLTWVADDLHDSALDALLAQRQAADSALAPTPLDAYAQQNALPRVAEERGGYQTTDS
ncbi:MAG TPA: hypothetical protein VKQ36_11375 [Ktedonobacterales bacterium]|nr:hypothetical protein [Ktedonobacterales bacterium]